MKKSKPGEHILTLTCPDRRGIVRAVSGLLAEHGCNILDSAQFSDTDTNTFFMRVHFADETGGGRSSGLIHADVRAVICNHEAFRALTESHGIPFRHLPVNNEMRPQQETRLLRFIEEERIGLVVLSRYVQGLSVVLARAVSWFLQQPILLNGDETIVFR